MSVEIFPEGQPAKKLGETTEETVSKTPEDYERAALRQHELEANTFGADLAPGEPPSEIDIGYLAKEEEPVEKGKEAIN